MGYTVLHIEKKGMSNLTMLGQHIDRTNPKSYRQVEKVNIQDLTNEKFKNIELQKAVKLRLEEVGITKWRKDAVASYSIILSGSHKDMKKIESDPEQFDQWIKTNKAFLNAFFGEENVVRFSLHLDEKTPHIHAVVVPIVYDEKSQSNKLAAKRILGTPQKLRSLQTDYAQCMYNFGLKRGMEYSTAKHTTAKEWYAQQELADKEKEDLKKMFAEEKIPAETMVSVLYNKVVNQKELEINNLIARDSIERFTKENSKLKRELEETNNSINKLFSDPKKLIRIANELLRKQEEEEKKRQEQKAKELETRQQKPKPQESPKREEKRKGRRI